MDNISFILKVPEHIVMNFIKDEKPDERTDYFDIVQKDNIYKKICLDNDNPNVWFELGEILHKEKQYSQAATCYARSLEEKQPSLDATYKYAYSLAKAFSSIGYRDLIELSLWENCICIDSSRSEAYEHLARYYKWRGNAHTAYMYAKIAYELNNYKQTTRLSDCDPLSCEIMYYELCYNCSVLLDAEFNLRLLKDKLSSKNENYDNFYINRINSILEKINNNKNNIRKPI